MSGPVGHRVRRDGVDARRLRFERDGFLSAVPILTAAEATDHRLRLERAEACFGPLHYQAKVHTILTSPLELATHPRALDTVTALIGQDVLLWNATYIVKEPGTSAHVSWHQDLAYWGLDGEDEVSMWLALSRTDESNGCMRMAPGSHRAGCARHRTTADAENVLYQGQTVDGVDEATAVGCSLMPGEASFHHGWTLHASGPNHGAERRIGFNAQYIATHMRQTRHERDTAMLVHGVDRFHHFGVDVPAVADLDRQAVARQRELEQIVRETMSAVDS
ncbi:MAG: phytanoyl-CoA dioxygenase family protein [Gammaproteobacteria bacterium]|nr:phytanoyl-CoA dioxygenase family protein [Gammaproteobacteria bacterium]